MSDFDYVAAWKGLARPAWECLPANVRDLALRAADAMEGKAQGPDLDMAWPEGFRAEFEKIPAEILAAAARAAYFVEHWKPTGETATNLERLTRAGGNWKFSNLCDQALTERLGLTRNRRGNRSGWSFEVHEGTLRMCVSWCDGWTWRELGPATVGTLKAAEGVSRPPAPVRDRRSKYTRKFDPERTLTKAEEACEPLLTALWIAWLGAGETYTPDPERDRRRAIMAAIPPVPEGATFRPVRIDTVVLPHPFMITGEHMRKSPWMYLDPSVAPCGFDGCRLTPDEHEKQETLFVEIPAGVKDLNAIPGLHAWLLEFKPQAEAAGIQGFAFPAALEEVR